jgi:Icc-related predicted phosphoesterase
MKLHVLNDLHLKHATMAPVAVEGDVLVLAGDIVDGGNPAPLLALTANYRAAGLPVLYVPGNHEFYGRRMHEVLKQLWRACRANGIELLHNRAVVIGGVRFFGSTLWTDYKLARASMQEKSMLEARAWLADHTWIFVREPNQAQARCFTPRDALAAHEKALRLMRARLTEPFDGPTVVISHHGPSPKSVHPKYAGHAVNPAFVSNLEHVMAQLKPVLWLHGHVHDSFDYEVWGSGWRTRVVANPRGYPRRRDAVEAGEFENQLFDASLLVEV